MQNKKLAESLIRSAFNPQVESNSKVLVQKKSYLIPFEGEVTKKFMKIASSTYVDLSEPEKVWRLELLEGKPYIVALERSNILTAEDYDVHDAVQGVMVYKGNKVIANIPLPPAADAKAIASKLKERVASINHLPSQLIIEVLTKEASSLSSVFINIPQLQNQTKIAAKKEPASEGLREYLKKVTPQLPSDMGARFEVLMKEVKKDPKKVELIQDIVDSYEKLIRAIQSNSPSVRYITKSLGIDTTELEDLLKEFGKEAKLYLDQQFLSRLIIAAEDPTVEKARTLFADLLVGMAQIKNDLTTIIGYTTQPEGPSMPGATLIRRRRQGEDDEIASGSAVSIQQQLAAIIALQTVPEFKDESAQKVYGLMEGKVMETLAAEAERLQSALDSGAEKVGSFSELRTKLADQLIPETQDAAKFVLKLTSKRPANNQIKIFNQRVFTTMEDYVASTNLLSSVTTELKDALAFSYTASSEIFINLPHSGRSLSGDPFTFSRPRDREEGMKLNVRSRELSQFQTVVEAARIAMQILNDSRKGRSEEEKELVAQEGNLKQVLPIAEQILARLQQQLSSHVPPRVILKDLSTHSPGMKKIYDVLSDVLPLASSIAPDRLSPQLVAQILTSILPVLTDPAFYKTEALLQLIKLATDAPANFGALSKALSTAADKVERFYQIWTEFERNANTFLATVEQGRTLLARAEEESGFKFNLPEFITQMQPAALAASLKQILKTAAPKELSFEQVQQRDIEASKALRALYNQLFASLNNAMPRATVIKALTDAGISKADTIIDKLPNRLYGRFLTTLLGNLGGMFTPDDSQIAIPSSGEGSVQVVTSAPGVSVTEGPQSAKNLLSAIGIPDIYTDIVQDAAYKPQLGVTLDMSKELKRQIREEVPLKGQPNMAPEFGMSGEEKILLPEIPKPSLYVPEIGWSTFDQLYKQLKPALQALGSSIEDQIASLYAAYKSPAGHSLIKSLRSVELAAPLYFYEVYNRTADDVAQANPKKVAEALARRDIQANPAVAKALAKMFFFQSPEQAQQVAKKWKEHVEYLAESYATPVKFIDQSLQERAKKYFMEPAHMVSFMNTLADTGVYQLVNAAKAESEVGAKLKRALRSGDLATAMSLFSGQAAYVLREQLDKALAEAPTTKEAPSTVPQKKTKPTQEA